MRPAPICPKQRPRTRSTPLLITAGRGAECIARLTAALDDMLQALRIDLLGTDTHKTSVFWTGGRMPLLPWNKHWPGQDRYRSGKPWPTDARAGTGS
jgi:hypothetical protein